MERDLQTDWLTRVAQNGDSIERLLFYALLARARSGEGGRGRRRTRTSAWLLMTLGHVYATKGTFIYDVGVEEAKLDQICRPAVL